MEIFDGKNNRIASPDLTRGYLQHERKLVSVIPAVPAVAEQGHYEVVTIYPNGGKDVEWVVDVPAVDEVPEQEVYEEYQRYIEYTPEQLAEIAHIEQERADNEPVTWAVLLAAYQEGVESA